MRIISLTKKKLGDKFSLVSIKYKPFFGKVVERDAYFDIFKGSDFEHKSWYWCDNGESIYRNREIISQFYDSSAFDYEVNSKRNTSF